MPGQGHGAQPVETEVEIEIVYDAEKDRWFARNVAVKKGGEITWTSQAPSASLLFPSEDLFIEEGRVFEVTKGQPLTLHLRKDVAAPRTEHYAVIVRHADKIRYAHGTNPPPKVDIW